MHTVLSVHAKGTVEEAAARAAALGYEAIAITDHCSLNMCHYERSVDVLLMQKIPQSLFGVRIFRGVEMDLHDYQGHLCFYNIPYDDSSSALDRLMATREVVIASPHFLPEGREGTSDEITEMYLGAIASPYVTTLGHPERINKEYDVTAVALAAAGNGTFLEVNNLSVQRGYAPQIAKMLDQCRAFGTRIVVNSDSHSTNTVGSIDAAKSLLVECNFPEELIANRSLAAFEQALADQHSRKRA